MEAAEGLEIRRNRIRVLFRPLVRLCLRSSLTIQDVSEVLKSLFIELAAEELTASGAKVNMRRLGLITGLHSREVLRHHKPAGPDTQKPTLNPLVRIIGTWSQDERFLTADKKPRTLTFKGEESEFATLVRSLNKFLGVGTVLFELERIGAVRKTKSGVRLLKPVQRYNQDPQKAYELLARDLDAKFRSVEENLTLKAEIPNLFSHTEYDNIYLQDLPKVRSWLLEEGRAFHKRAREFVSQFDRDLHYDVEKEACAGGKVVLGAFSFTSSGAERSPKKK